MPLYQTNFKLSLEDLIADIEEKGEEIIDRQRLENGTWSILTRPARRDGNVVHYSATETRPGWPGMTP